MEEPRSEPRTPQGVAGILAMEDCDVHSAASILASVKEQEARFERLTRALEQERRHVALQLGRAQQPGMGGSGTGGGQPLPMAWQQLVLQEQSPGSQASLATMPEAPEVLEETVTVERDPGTPTSHVSIVTSEDGTTRRTETKVTKTVKTVTTRTVRQAAIRDCGGVPALVRLLRAARDNEVRELVTGTLWNLSSYEPLKMVIIDHGLQTLTHEVIVPHSGWEREPNEDSKPRDAEWTTVFKNTSGCLRNVSSDGAEARRRLRECEGLVDALLHALQSAVGRKDTDNKSVENCVCIMRNLSYHVHKEVPGADRYQEAEPGPLGSAAGSQRRRRDDASCFGGKKAKGKKDGNMDRNFDTLDLPKRTEAAKGFELLYQPEVVRLYLSLLTESRNFNTLEAAAGALQNLSAGNWMWATYIRATVRKERGLPVLVELLQSETDKVVRAVAIALRNLSLDRRNKDLIGSYAMAELVRNVRNAQAPARPGARLEEDTVVAVLNTIHEIVSDSLDNARSLLQARGVPALVALVASSQSVREAKAASHVLQTVWSYKELRGALQRDGWTKARFQSAAAAAKGPKGAPSPGGFDDSTLPLVDKSLDSEKPGSRDLIPMDTLGPDGYSTVDRRERRVRDSDSAGEASEKEPLKSVISTNLLCSASNALLPACPCAAAARPRQEGPSSRAQQARGQAGGRRGGR
ncbi:Armadillo repeat protein deleted in velo-cardio-facial syndrome [Tupaia chinensis]|uniref:Armadillo repeat protein deleted in velo-cardio-facial syndrome n=1 Tax=Tupaia chinensis TaxID=246437 RepID=L9KU51_TUPCH|nr:Armadillo repeat protein deleted in velo-cardio-facial syndrome [Tupaia chinensis]